MKKCKSCQSEIDGKAKKCPHCQTDQRSWFRRHPILTGIGGLIAFIVIIGTFGSSTSKKSTTTTQPTTGENTTSEQEEVAIEIPTSVNLRNFLAEFDGNQLAAEEKWSGKLIEFTGTVSNISGSANRPYISFRSESEEFLGASVTCRTLKDNSQATSLKNGQSVVVNGVVKNQSLGIVDLTNCVFK